MASLAIINAPICPAPCRRVEKGRSRARAAYLRETGKPLKKRASKASRSVNTLIASATKRASCTAKCADGLRARRRSRLAMTMREP